VTRARGWESRLIAVMREASLRPYAAREWNCARFAHTCAQVVQGRALPFAWKGSLENSVDAVLLRVEVRQAQRADLVLAHVPEPSLGVCIGAQAAFVTPAGLMTVPMRNVRIAWSV
jgi:hypothetical protein